jgi:hypothetical protein
MGARGGFTKGPTVGPLVVIIMLFAGACSQNSGLVDEVPKNPPAEHSYPARLVDPGAELSARATAGLDRDFDAVYELETNDRSSATVRIMRTGRNLRIDIDRAGAQSRLLLGPEGATACQVKPGVPACLRVALPGRNLPRRFDPGIQRLFLDTIRQLAFPGNNLSNNRGNNPQVIETPGLPAGDAFPAAACYRVRGGQLGGVYCLSRDGILRRAIIGSGKLDLRSYGPPAGSGAFTPPAAAIPLPTE